MERLRIPSGLRRLAALVGSAGFLLALAVVAPPSARAADPIVLAQDAYADQTWVDPAAAPVEEAWVDPAATGETWTDPAATGETWVDPNATAAPAEQTWTDPNAGSGYVDPATGAWVDPNAAPVEQTWVDPAAAPVDEAWVDPAATGETWTDPAATGETWTDPNAGYVDPATGAWVDPNASAAPAEQTWTDPNAAAAPAPAPAEQSWTDPAAGSADQAWTEAAPAPAQTGTAPAPAAEPAPVPTAPAAPSSPIATAWIAGSGGDGAACRTSPDPGSAEMGTLADGSTVDVVGQTMGEWQPVNCFGGTGYVHASLLAWEGPSAAAPTAAAPVAAEASVEPALAEQGGRDGRRRGRGDDPSGASGGSAPVASGSGSGQSIVDFAMGFVGYPYVYAGADPSSGFDCSGFTMYVIQQTLGIDITHDLFTQVTMGTSVGFGELQPGDLVFFQNTFRPGLSHAGIYIGGGQFVHSENEETDVKVSDINSDYYASRFYGARRLT